MQILYLFAGTLDVTRHNMSITQISYYHHHPHDDYSYFLLFTTRNDNNVLRITLALGSYRCLLLWKI